MLEIKIRNRQKLILPVETEIHISVLCMDSAHTTYGIDMPFATADYRKRLRHQIQRSNCERLKSKLDDGVQ